MAFLRAFVWVIDDSDFQYKPGHSFSEEIILSKTYNKCSAGVLTSYVQKQYNIKVFLGRSSFLFKNIWKIDKLASAHAFVQVLSVNTVRCHRGFSEKVTIPGCFYFCHFPKYELNSVISSRMLIGSNYYNSCPEKDMSVWEAG